MGEDRRTEGEALVALQVRMDGLEESQGEMKGTLKELMDKVNNRVPVWVMVVISLLASTTTWFAKG